MNNYLIFTIHLVFKTNLLTIIQTKYPYKIKKAIDKPTKEHPKNNR